MDDPFRSEYFAIVRELERNPSKAIMSRLFQLVEKAYAPAIYTFSVCLEKGIGVEKNEQHAFEYCKAAADLGNGAALNNMGCNYLEGRLVAKNPELALRYFSSAAQKGHVAAMHNSAYIMDKGIGVEADGDLALKRYKWAYGNGHTRSANNIGVFFISGKHVDPDVDLAQLWFEKGAANGDDLAKMNLEKLKESKKYNKSPTFSEFRRYADIWLDGGFFN